MAAAAGVKRALAWALLCLPPGLGAAPYVPDDPATVLERLPVRATDPVARELAALRATAAAAPEALAPALALARRHLALGRAEADPRQYGYAQAALARWWADPPPPVRLLRAVLAQNRHDFVAALADLDAVLAAEPGNAEAWLTRAVIEMVQGEPQAAARSCVRLARAADRVLALGCAAAAAALTGQAPTAYALLATLAERTDGVDPALRQWLLTVLAETAVQLDRPEAEAHFRAALALAPRDPYLLAARADYLLDHDRADEVVALLAGRTAVDALLLRLVLAERRLDVVDAPAHAALLRARFADAQARGDTLHQALQARLLLADGGDAATALALAEQNWQRQREPIDARLLLEAAHAAAAPAAARPVLDWLARTGLQDRRLDALAAWAAQTATRDYVQATDEPGDDR